MSCAFVASTVTVTFSVAFRIRYVCISLLVVHVLFVLALLDFEQRRLRDVDVAAIDQLGHLPIEERQQQRANVRAVNVRVAQQDDAVVPKLRHIEIVLCRCPCQTP